MGLGRPGRLVFRVAPSKAPEWLAVTPDQSSRPETDTARPHPAEAPAGEWWRHAVIYQIYPRSWADSSGDGVGDLPGITARLPYLRELGVDAVWLSPFFVSPMADAGYDVADYLDVDPIFGELADADALVATAHELDLRVIVDLVPNHSSDEHTWFRAALAAGSGSPERERYIFRDGLGENGERPPNDWESVFGGPAWTRVRGDDGQGDDIPGDDMPGKSPQGRPAGQWYLHLFDPKQPDFNWRNPEVEALFESVLRFWLDRGVDGFRVDVAHGLVKARGLPSWQERPHMLGDSGGRGDHHDDTGRAPMWDQEDVHVIYRQWRKIVDSYNPTGDPSRDRVLCAEAWVEQERAVRYVRSDEMHQAFNFDFLQTPWRAADLRKVITDSLHAAEVVGAPTTWVLSNHDVVRHASRLGMPVGRPRSNGIGADDPQPDAGLGTRRARAATMLMLGLPGSAYLYQGEELGLPEHTTMPDELRQDPTWQRSGHTERGRDGARVPMPWEADLPAYGFGPTGRTWLPQPDSYGPLAVDQQDGVVGSTLELYRTLLRMRRGLALGLGSLSWLPDWGEHVVAYQNRPPGGRPALAVVTNLGSDPLPVPDGARIVAASADLVGGALPGDATVWIRP